MTLERKNPLPKGVYWADFFSPPVGGASISAIKEWLIVNQGKVEALQSSYHGPDINPIQALVSGAYTMTPILAAIASTLPGTGTARLWVLFRVKDPVFWPAVEFGFPTIAEQSTQESETVSGREPEPSLFQKLSALFAPNPEPKDYSNIVKYTGVATVLGGIAMALKLKR